MASLFLRSMVHAGISGENVILVVNAESVNSRTVANHYAALRKIPSINIVFLDDVPDGLVISLDDFRNKVLMPILNAINERKIASQARVIAYSVDFPTSVKIKEHTDKLTDPSQKQYQLPVASINGLTYLYRLVLSDNPAYLGWGANMYARREFDRHFANSFSGDVGKRFDTAIQLGKDEKHAESAALFSSLAREFPTLGALSIQAATAYAKAGDDASAASSIVLAIRGGWKSATYLRQSPQLARLVEKPSLKPLIDQLSDAPIALQGPVAFGSNRGWTPSGGAMLSTQGGVPYLLSCMLGVIHERGSTLEQVLFSLRRSARADRTMPEGKFGFSKTGDVRSTTRMPGVPAALGRLLSQGFTPEVFASALPTKSETYNGLMLGTATMKLNNRSFKFAPGAIAESLTSLGAVFQSAGQTKLTVLLNAGAAISSGAVTEPFALQFKFPLPAIHAYYAEGASAIEAFYLSVSSPYQLLIVGDPVCQPFSQPPNESVVIDFQRGEKAEIIMRKTTSSVAKNPILAGQMEIFVEGRLIQSSPSKSEIRMRLPGESSGVIDIRVALIARDPMETRMSYVRSVDLNGPLAAPVLEYSKQNVIERVTVSCAGADSIEVTHLGFQIGIIEGSKGTLTIDRSVLGDGPLRLRPVATIGNDKVLGKTVAIR